MYNPIKYLKSLFVVDRIGQLIYQKDELKIGITI